MIKIYLPKILLVLFVSMIFTGCNKPLDDYLDPGAPPDLTTKVRSSVSGFVTDENNLAVNLATVQVGNSTVTTDKYGYFEANNVDVVKTAATVTVSKAGYFKGIKTYIASEGKSAFFRIKLIPKTIAGTVNSASGGTVTLTNGLSISLPAGAVVNAASNAAYTGTVNIIAYWIDPSGADLPGTMPGDLRGLNTAGNLQLLNTYGMAAVELTGSGGELLQMAVGKKATLSLPIPSSLLSSAPASIPLWYFDEATGLWKEEGSATKTGSNYVGQVSHFSFWNCDVANSFVQFNATFVGSNNQTLQHAFVKISVIANPANVGYGITDAAGYVSGAIPANAQLLLEVFSSSSCTSAVYSQSITTTTANISLGTITIPTGNNIATITGNVVNCAGVPVTNGYIIVKNGNYYFHFGLDNNGHYSVNILPCGSASSSVILIGEDVATQQQSIPATYIINAGNNAMPLIQACGTTIAQFVHLTVNGTPQNYDSPVDTVLAYQSGPGSNVIVYSDPPYFVVFGSFSFSGFGLGNNHGLMNFQLPQVIANLPPVNPPVIVYITEWGAPGQFMAGNFSGLFTGPAPGYTQYNITCSFRVRRNY